MKDKFTMRKKRAQRVRRRIKETGRPRLSVVKSNSHIQVQLIDDEKGVTVAGASTYSKGFRGTEYGKKSRAAAEKLGAHIAELAKKANVEKVVLDRGAHKYHGVVAAVADAARNAGLKF